MHVEQQVVCGTLGLEQTLSKLHIWANQTAQVIWIVSRYVDSCALSLISKSLCNQVDKEDTDALPAGTLLPCLVSLFQAGTGKLFINNG